MNAVACWLAAVALFVLVVAELRNWIEREVNRL